MAAEQKVRVKIEADGAQANREIQQAEGAFKRFGNFLRSRFVFTLNDVSNAIRGAFDAIREAGNLESQTAALRRSLAQQGQSFDEYLAKLDEVAQGQVSTADLIKSTSQALLLGIPAEQIAELLEIARASAIATGQSVSTAFQDIATGIGRASPLILDNLGITLKLGDAYQRLADETGKSTDELTEQEKKQALLNEVLRIGRERVELFGDSQSELSAAINQSTAALDDFRQGANRVGAALVTSVASIVTKSAQGFVAFAEVLAAVTAEISRLLSALPLVGDFFRDITQESLRFERGLSRTRRRLGELSEELSRSANAQAAVLLGLRDNSEELQNNAEAAARNADRLRDRNVVVRESTEEQTEFNEELTDGVVLLDDYRTSIEAETRANREAALAIERVRIARERELQVQQQADQQRRTRNLLGGESEFAQIGGGRFSVTPPQPAPGFTRRNLNGALRFIDPNWNRV